MSAGCFDNASCCLSLYKMNQHQFLNTPPQVEVEKQGITSILTSDFNSNTNSHNQIVLPFHNSIRRTLSADMSSQKWLQNNGFPHSSVKRVKSSLQLQPLGEQPTTPCHHDNNKGPAFEEIWSSIQAHKNSWGCILSSGSGSGQEVSPPYVHPLAKRTGSSLSEKSLEICTESLGSETGSDGFSYPPSDSDEEQEEEEEEEEEEQLMKEYNVQQQVVGVGINNRGGGVGVGVGPTSKRALPTRPSFPPPLPSLGHRDDGSNLHIRSHRQDGRLVVEAVSVPSQNCFHAQRQDGRLLLTFCPTHDDQPQNHDEDEDEDGDDTNDHIYQDINNNNVQAIEKEKGGVVEVQRSCTPLSMMSKFMELTNKSSTWPRNYNTSVIKTLKHEEQHTVDDDDDDDEVPLLPMTLTKSLPPRPIKSTTTTSAALNAYEYYWRRSNSTAVGMLNPLGHANANANATNANANNNKKSVGKHTKRNNNKLLYAAHTVKKGGGGAANEYAVPLMLRGCKEAKKPSLLLWEPYCIATS